MLDYIRFRSFAAPMLIEILFWIAVVLALIGAFVGVAMGLVAMFNDNKLTGFLMLASSAIMLPIQVLFIRIGCEGAIVIFRIYEELKLSNGGNRIED